MDAYNPLRGNSTHGYLVPIERYKEAVIRRFPTLPSRVANNCSIFPSDALALGYFLEYYPRRVVALEIGAFVGISTFCFASHLKVSKVISVDPNPVISEELIANTDRWVGEIDLEPLKDLKVFDVARAVLEDFDEEREKIERHEGVVGSTQVGAKGGTIPGLQKIDVPVVDSINGEGLVALVDGLHTREGVQADLAAIFEKNSRAVALMDDCRYGWGHLVQAGVVNFMEEAAEDYHFRLLADLGPGLAKSSFGILYPESIAAETDEVLEQVRTATNQQLDPMRSMKREFEQTRRKADRFESRIANLEEQLSSAREKNTRISERASRLEKEKDQFKERKTQLEIHYSSRRYKVADAVAEAVVRMPILRSLLHRNSK